jgi:hypothetical protein
MGLTGYVGRDLHTEMFVGKLEGKIPLERPRRKWEDNIKIELREVGWEDVDWIHLDPNRDQWQVLVNTVTDLRDLKNNGNFLSN